MNRPKWMSLDAWLEFVKRWQDDGGVIRCVTPDCGEASPDHLTVDHIKPRSSNGSDGVSNLQPLCRVCNSRKGPRADGYWQRTLYFDKSLNTNQLRVAQIDYVYNPIMEYAEFFARPYSTINGKLFCFIQIVGAGKTLGMFCLPFALNAAANRSHRAQPRVDRMLIVTKDQALRGQITRELIDEPLRFGFVNERPRIVEATKREMLLDGDYDIAVMCPNMLWPQADNDPDSGNVAYAWGPGIERILNRHPLIVFDEMHYAHRNIQRLIHAARHSLVFGFTASPIDACGDLLQDMVRVTVYTYHDAVVNDGSMKHID
jgi:hypothetical protein